MISALRGKNIVLAVSGGIAAYKIPELLRILQRSEADVRVVMTENACRFITPLTFEALSGHRVLIDLFDKNYGDAIAHIDLAKKCDAVVVAPATANIIGKLANGIADDALSTFMLAASGHKLICPAMNTNMYENRRVQNNIERLESDGYIIVEPSAGELACKEIGPGRLAVPEKIADRLDDVLTVKDLNGKTISVSAGPTREYIDPVRFISNPSSGKMGYAIAAAAKKRGGRVNLISGPVVLDPPEGVNIIKVVSAAEMAEAMFAYAKLSDIIIKAAAVSDYRALETFEYKVKKSADQMRLTFCKTTDILKEIGMDKKEGQFIVGFAAETEDIERNALKKLDEKNLDMIVANIVGKEDSGFESETNRVTFFFKNAEKESLSVMTKYEISDILLDRILKLYKKDAIKQDPRTT